MKKNMTNGHPLKLLIAFAIPLILGNIIQQFYSMADAIIVGRTISVNALAAIGTTGGYCFLIFGFFWGLTTGLTTITGQHFGARNYDKVKESFATSIVISSILCAITTVICLFITDDLLVRLNVPEVLFKDSYHYLFVMFLGLSGISFYNLMACLLRSLGDSKTPLFFLIVASLLNVGLDFLFILAFGWGVVSVAWATVISQVLSGIWCYYYAMHKFSFLKLHKGDWHFKWSVYWAHLRIALPMAFQLSVIAIGVIILQSEINKIGATVISAYTIATRVEQLTTQPLCSFAATIGVFVAQNYGAKKFNRIRVAVTQMSIFSTIISLVLGIIVVCIMPQFIKLFVGSDAMTESPELLKYARTYMLITLPFYLPLQLMVNYRQALQSMSFPIITFIACAIELFARGALAPIFNSWFGFVGVCFVSPIGWVIALVALAIFYYKKIYHYTKSYL